MKSCKKYMSVLLAVCLIFAMAVPAFATTSEPDKAVRELAYMDLEKAPDEMQQEILTARNAIIFGNQSWTVNGAVKKHNADGTIETLPEFSDLFPGWDVPITHTIPAFTSGVTSGSVRSSIGFTGNVKLMIHNGASDSPAFYNFTGIGTDVKAYAKTLAGTRYNLGFTNEDTMQSVGWVANLPVGAADGYSITAKASVRYSVRASVYKAEDIGFANMVVEDLG